MSESSAAWLLYDAAGRPAQAGDQQGRCRVCGHGAIGLDFSMWVRPTFTDTDRLLPGDILCHACQFVFSEACPELTALTGKDKPQRMRNYSHFVVGDTWHPVSKGNKPWMYELLMQCPEVAVIAVSGQKHTLPWARVGWWQWEQQALIPCPGAVQAIRTPMQMLCDAGFSKAEIETGQYRHDRILAYGMDAWRHCEALLKEQRGSAPFTIALFFVQKEVNSDDRGDIRGGESAASSDLAGHIGRIQEPIQADDLATIRGQPTQRGIRKQPGADGQLALFTP